MRKAVVRFTLLFLCMILFTSCGNKTTPPAEKGGLNVENEYIIGIRYMDFSTKGRLIIKEDGILHFKHEDPNSVLNGMEEIISDDKIIVKYKGLEWESAEVDTAFSEIKAIFDAVMNKDPSDCENTSIRGIETKQRIFELGKDTILFNTEKNSGTPVQISGTFSDHSFSINFYYDTAENASESIA